MGRTRADACGAPTAGSKGIDSQEPTWLQWPHNAFLHFVSWAAIPNLTNLAVPISCMPCISGRWQEGWEPGIGGSLSYPLWPDCTICTMCQFLLTAKSQAICFQGVKADKDQQNVMLWHTDAHDSVWYSKVLVSWDQTCHTIDLYCCIIVTILMTWTVHRGKFGRFRLMELWAEISGVMWQV